ncbi:hypothetical protein U9M48_030345, partial [Paspalum notatum var. saurae]
IPPSPSRRPESGSASPGRPASRPLRPARPPPHDLSSHHSPPAGFQCRFPFSPLLFPRRRFSPSCRPFAAAHVSPPAIESPPAIRSPPAATSLASPFLSVGAARLLLSLRRALSSASYSDPVPRVRWLTRCRRRHRVRRRALWILSFLHRWLAKPPLPRRRPFSHPFLSFGAGRLDLNQLCASPSPSVGPSIGSVSAPPPGGLRLSMWPCRLGLWCHTTTTGDGVVSAARCLSLRQIGFIVATSTYTSAWAVSPTHSDW